MKNNIHNFFFSVGCDLFVVFDVCECIIHHLSLKKALSLSCVWVWVWLWECWFSIIGVGCEEGVFCVWKIIFITSSSSSQLDVLCLLCLLCECECVSVSFIISLSLKKALSLSCVWVWGGCLLSNKKKKKKKRHFDNKALFLCESEVWRDRDSLWESCECQIKTLGECTW